MAVFRIAARHGVPDHPQQVAKTLLIVDDHAGFRASARALLERHGFEVVGEAENGAAGIRAAGELRPDVVLLDVQLPDADGIEVAARMAEVAPGSAVVLTSSLDPSGLEPFVRASGARGFITKSQISGSRISMLLD